VFDSAVEAMRRQGAQVEQVDIPQWLLDVAYGFDHAIHDSEFKPAIARYLATTAPSYPKTLEDLIARSRRFVAPREDGAIPATARWNYFATEDSGPSVDHPLYAATREHGMPLVREILQGLMARQHLDAIVFPTAPWRAMPLATATGQMSKPAPMPFLLPSLAGLPVLAVPAGFTGDGLPVDVSFLGRAWSEPRLLSLGYAYEQASCARRLPRTTPLLSGDFIPVPPRSP
jgi:amidase